ncbi:hypothetical protein P8C59_003289 [Phyllachora maydis]|uniref:Uncharacterized protein n=1 Tax=Phyllachora maydis TaxID=1825666 RepID=A0AAD9HZZ0_9PEZI|nr:hypothetical protein P8C59_003289 [Phyllachora maydis]
MLDAFFTYTEALPSLDKASGTAAAEPAKPADTTAVPAAAAEPAGAAAAAVVDDIGDAVPPIISTLSARIALRVKAEAKAEEEEEEEEEGEEEEDKEVVEKEEDVGGRGKEDEGLYTYFELLLPYLTISIVATSRMLFKGNS